MAAPDTQRLVRAAVHMRAHNSDAWDEFVKAFQEHSAQVLTQMMTCPQEKLQMAQGMSIMAAEYAQIFVKAPDTYNALIQRNHANGQQKRTGI